MRSSQAPGGGIPFGMPPAGVLSHETQSNSRSSMIGGSSIGSSNPFGSFNMPPSSHQMKYSNGPILANENDFPSLGNSNRSPGSGMMYAGGIGTYKQSDRPAYANFMRQDAYGSAQAPVNRVDEFHIANEDFPALGGGHGGGGGSNKQPQDNEGGQPTSNYSVNHQAQEKMQRLVGESSASGPPQQPQQQQQAAAPVQNGLSSVGAQPTRSATSAPTSEGIQTESGGRVTNIPRGMLNDQFGMAGLLTFLRAIETDPGIVALALGHDLTTLGLNLNAQEKNLYQSFGGPWQDTPCRPQDIDYPIPEEYAVYSQVKDKLPKLAFNNKKFHDDLLFWIFYNYPGEMYQLAAAHELFARDWRFHKKDKVWVTRAHQQPVRQEPSYEQGEYVVFEPRKWKRENRSMILYYSELESTPVLSQVAEMDRQRLYQSTQQAGYQQQQFMSSQQQQQMYMQQQQYSSGSQQSGQAAPGSQSSSVLSMLASNQTQ